MTTMPAPGGAPVVVGVDHSRLSRTAVRLAAREAALRSRPLRIVHAFNWVGDPSAARDEQPRRTSEQLIDLAVALAIEAQPGIATTAALIEGPVVTTLLRESGSAALLVVGDGGPTDDTSVLADATSVKLAARAGCSVLVARESPPAAGPVLVGVDDSTSSLSVLGFAFDTATRRAAELIVVEPWSPDERPGDTPDEAAERLAEAVTPWRQRYPSVPVSQYVRPGDPKAALVEEAGRAELVVVSARGEPVHGRLGAVSQTMLYHSPAPVVVVRSPHEVYIQE